MKKSISLILFIVAVLIIGLIIGHTTSPAAWYSALNKPAYTPPNSLFAPVWTILYILIAIVGWRVFIARPNKPLSILWGLQMVLNFIWSPVFFGGQMIAAALVILVAMVITVAIFIGKAAKTDKLSAVIFVPYVIWLAIATYLNAGVLFLN